MKTINEVLNSKFVEDLLKDPKPTFLPYLKSDGPIITADNQAVVVETLMLDYLKKKMEISEYFKNHQYTKSDLEVLKIFEDDVKSKIGKRVSIMHFYMYDPSKDIKPQLETVMLEKNFQSWAIE